MSALLAHAKAARIMAEALDLAAHIDDPATAAVLRRLSWAHLLAATRMETEIAAEAEALNAPCSLRHDVAKGSKCPGCGKVR